MPSRSPCCVASHLSSSPAVRCFCFGFMLRSDVVASAFARRLRCSDFVLYALRHQCDGMYKRTKVVVQPMVGTTQTPLNGDFGSGMFCSVHHCGHSVRFRSCTRKHMRQYRRAQSAINMFDESSTRWFRLMSTRRQSPSSGSLELLKTQETSNKIFHVILRKYASKSKLNLMDHRRDMCVKVR